MKLLNRVGTLADGMNDTERKQWASARSLADLGELTARWLEGDLPSQPAYPGGYGPDDETLPLIPALAALNRAGFVTACSQPGDPLSPGHDGVLWEQRAAVDGFAGPVEFARIRAVAKMRGLIAVIHSPVSLPRWRVSYEDTVPVTRRDGQPYTWFGAQLSRRHLRDSWVGYGICHRDAVNALCGAWQVSVIDPQWGRNDLLWPVLTRAVAGCEVTS